MASFFDHIIRFWNLSISITNMGQASSTTRNASKGILITLDALGTIYKFKEPISKQYLDVARNCGVTTTIQENDLDTAFRRSYKSFVSKYPNYGKGKLESPEIWWKDLVHDTFKQVIDDVPEDLGLKLYQHFTSSEAYELFPDVKPFLQSLQSIRKEYSTSKPPALILGVVTNSDPRVRNVFEEFQLNIGDVRVSELLRKSRTGKFPWTDTWNPERDFDFVTTSYDAGSEKPSSNIFAFAHSQATTVLMGKTLQDLDQGVANGIRGVMNTGNVARIVGEMKWIHVGDERVKDLEAVENCGGEGLLIDREGKGGEKTIESLEDLGTVINLIVQDSFKT